MFRTLKKIIDRSKQVYLVYSSESEILHIIYVCDVRSSEHKMSINMSLYEFAGLVVMINNNPEYDKVVVEMDDKR